MPTDVTDPDDQTRLTHAAIDEFGRLDAAFNNAGAVDTSAFRNSMGATTPEGEAAVAAMHPLGRISRPDEIASLCVYLLSSETSFVTGAALAIDDGFTAQ